MEYLVTMTTRVPAATPGERVDEIRAREAAHSRELAAEGHLLRLWRPPSRPGEWRTLGLFAAADPDELEGVLASMPLRIWRSDEITPLAPHPNDPATATRPGATVTEFLTTFTVKIPESEPTENVKHTLAHEARRARAGRPGLSPTALLDIEVLLDRPPGVGEDGPLGADRVSETPAACGGRRWRS